VNFMKFKNPDFFCYPHFVLFPYPFLVNFSTHN